MEWASPWHLKELVIQERGKPCQQKQHKVACDVCHRGDVLLWVWGTRKWTDDNDWGRLRRPRVSGSGWSGTWKQRKGRTGLAIWKHMVQRAYQRLIKDRRGQLRRCEAEKKKRRCEAGKRLGADGSFLYECGLVLQKCFEKNDHPSYIAYMERRRRRSSK